MTTRSGKADRSTVRLSVLSAISPPCSDLATIVLGHKGGDRQERHAGHEGSQYHQREHPCDKTLVDHVDVVYRRFLPTCGHEAYRAKERQSRDGDEQVVTSHIASPGGQVDSGQDEDVDQQAECERRNLRLERPSRMVAPCNVLHMVQYAEDRRRCRDNE